MAKVIIILFFLFTGVGSYYMTHEGIGQQEVVTVEDQNVRRSSSFRYNSSGGGNSGGYSYGK